MYRLMTFVAMCTTPVLIVFITIKAVGYVNWSWWLVFSPMFASIFLMLGRIPFRPLTPGEKAMRSIVDRFDGQR